MASIFLRCHSGGEDNECTCQEVGDHSLIPRRPTLEELAVSPISEDLKCLLCGEVFTDAVTAVCGDVFCKACLLEASGLDNATCPQCDEPLEWAVQGGGGATSRFVRKLVGRVQVRCENALSYDHTAARFTPTPHVQRACQATMPFNNYPNHLQTCSFALLACPYQLAGCQLAVERDAYDAHSQQCEYRPEICQCGELFSRTQREEHLSVCAAGEGPCPHSLIGCLFRGGGAKMKDHLLSCPYELLKIRLYTPIAEKGVEECVASVKSEAETLQWNHKGEPEELEKQLSQVKEGAFLKLQELTVRVPQELRTQAQENLRKALDVMDFLPPSPPSTPKLTSPNFRSSVGSGGNKTEVTHYSLEDVSLATNDFSSSNLLGKGGFGSVYRGVLDGTPVAVKRLHAGGNSQEFEFEVSILQRIRHPHIVLLMGCNQDVMCIVSEFLPGGSLDERLKGKGGPLPWADRLRICAEMSAALLYLHRNGILHRDLKPANVLLDENNHCKLADMGLAKLFQDTIMSLPKGTFGYIDPFQLQTGQLSRSSDVYALGLIILQLLTGQRRIQAIHSLLENCKPQLPTRDLENATSIFLERLDPSAGQWDVDVAKAVVRMAIRCVERVKDSRPDLKTEVQPELFWAAEAAKNSLVQILEKNLHVNIPPRSGTSPSPTRSRISSPLNSDGGGGGGGVSPPPPTVKGQEALLRSVKPQKVWNDNTGDASEPLDYVRSVRWVPGVQKGERVTVRRDAHGGAGRSPTHADAGTTPPGHSSLSSPTFTNSGSSSEALPHLAIPNDNWISKRDRMTKSTGTGTAGDMEQQGKEADEEMGQVLPQAQKWSRQADEQWSRREYLRAHNTYQHALSLLPSTYTHTDPRAFEFVAKIHIGRAWSAVGVASWGHAGGTVAAVRELADILAPPPAPSRRPAAAASNTVPTSPSHATSTQQALQPALLLRARAYRALANWRLADQDLDRILRVSPNDEQAAEIRASMKEEYRRATAGIPPPLSSLDDGDSFLGSSEMGGVHFGETCQSCGMTPICGLLFGSVRKRQQNFCQRCMEEQAANPEDFVEVAPPEHSNAQFLYSLGYPHGICLIRSKRDTISLLQKAAQRGHPLAKTALGQHYLKGDGVTQDHELALKWLCLGATLPEEQFDLGKMYQTGTNVAKSYAEAVKMFSLAALHGHAGALKELAGCYRRGKGVPADPEEEARLLKLAAVAVETGHLKAQLKLGR